MSKKNFTKKEISKVMNELIAGEAFSRKSYPIWDYVSGPYDHSLDFSINEDFAIWELEMRSDV